MADTARGAGHALIRVAGAAGTTAPRFRISKPPGWENPSLGPSGWQGAEADLQPLDASPDGADLVLAVGPGVCSWLEEGTFLFSLPAASLSTAIAWPEIEEVHGGSGSTFDERRAVAGPVVPNVSIGAVGPAAAPPSPVPDGPVAGAAAAPVAKGNGVRNTSALLSLVALILIIGGGAWWWQRQVPGPPAEVQAAAEPLAPAAPPVARPAAAPPAPAPPAPDLDAIGVADLVGRNNSADMLAQARRRLATRPQDSLLLLEAAGDDRHDGAALTELARLYDPAKPRQGGIPADPRQAAKYYRGASRVNDESGREDREALRRFLQARRDVGDLSAKLIEQDYWP